MGWSNLFNHHYHQKIVPFSLFECFHIVTLSPFGCHDGHIIKIAGSSCFITIANCYSWNCFHCSRYWHLNYWTVTWTLFGQDTTNYCCYCYYCYSTSHHPLLLPTVSPYDKFIAIAFVSTLLSIVNAISRSCSFGFLVIDYPLRISCSRLLMWCRLTLGGGGAWRISIFYKYKIPITSPTRRSSLTTGISWLTGRSSVRWTWLIGGMGGVSSMCNGYLGMTFCIFFVQGLLTMLVNYR